MADYDRWASFYDLIQPGLPGEAEFYVGQAVRFGGRALELGCGTGRIAIPMAMCGAEVVGLDNSAGMLDICSEKLAAVGAVKGSLELVQADMRDFQLTSQFQYVAMPYRTFMHLLTPADQLKCLEAAYRHLEPGGVFVLNYWIPNGFPQTNALQSKEFRLVETLPLADFGETLRHYHRMSFDTARQRINDEHRLEIWDEDNQSKAVVRFSLQRAWLQPEEMRDRARRAGFLVEAVFQDFDCTPYARPGEMIWVLRKGG